MNPGRTGAIKLAKSLGLRTKIIVFPDQDEKKVDVNSYFASNHTNAEFEVLRDNSKEVLEVMLSIIPKNLPRIDLKEGLSEIFDYLTTLEEIDALSRLNNIVQPYFGIPRIEFADYIKYFKTLIKKKKADLRKNDKHQEDEIVEYKSFLETDDYLIEQIKDISQCADDAELAVLSSETVYIVFDKKTETTKVVKEFEYNGIIYKPVVDDLLRTGTIQLPTGINEYGTTTELVQEIREFLQKYFEVQGFFHEFLPYLCLFYWIFEKFPFVPYVHFVGRTGTGKTTALEVFGSICYKPIDASGSITMSPIFRAASTWRGSLLLDEFEVSGDNYKAMIAFLKSGVGNRAVLRTEGESVREVKAYNIKAPKVFTSENPITDAGLQSRTFVVRMQKNRREVPLFRINSYNAKAAELRNKLLLWRFRNYNKIDLKTIEYGFKELSCFDGRVKQVLTPIYLLADEATRKILLSFAHEQEEETLRERAESQHGQIFQIIVDFIESGTTLGIKEITSKFNSEYNDSTQQLTPKKVSGIVRKTLGFDIEKRGHDKVSTVIVNSNDSKFIELCKYYGIVFSSDASTADYAGSQNSTKENNDPLDLFDGELPDLDLVEAQ